MHGVVQCEVTVVRDGAGLRRSFVLRIGNILRIGRGPGNDIVLDFDGVSSYHAELFLRASGASHGLCVRDNSKNGTGIRPGPDAPDSLSWANGIEPVWETLRRGAFRSIDHGWQLVVPIKSGRGADQPPEQANIMTVYVGEQVCAAEAAELDGEAWEPDASIGDQEADVGNMPSPARIAPPPPPDLGGLAFEEPPGPPLQSLQANTGRDAAPAHRPGTAAAGASLALAEQQAVKDHFLARDEEIWERLELDTMTEVPLGHSGGHAVGDQARAGKSRSHDTSRTSEQSQQTHWVTNQAAPSSSSDDTSDQDYKKSRRKRKRKQREKQPKKTKKKKAPKKAKAPKRETRAKRNRDTKKQERRKKVIKKRKPHEDSEETDLELWIRKKAQKRLALQKTGKTRQNKRLCDTSTSQSDEVECQKQAKQLQTQKTNGKSSERDCFKHETSACQSDGGHVAGHPHTEQQVHKDEDVCTAISPQVQEQRPQPIETLETAHEFGQPKQPIQKVTAENKAIIALEISDSDNGNGFFLLCGIHSEQPMFRRIRDGEPSFLFFNRCNAGGSVGWHIGSGPGRTLSTDPEEFWHSDLGTLPAIGKGVHGGRMQAHKALDHSLLTALGAVDNRLCCEIRTAFSVAVGGGAGPGAVVEADQEVEGGSGGGRREAGEAPCKVGSMDVPMKEHAREARNGLHRPHVATPAVPPPSPPDRVVNNTQHIGASARSDDSNGSGRTLVPNDLCEDTGETRPA